MIPPKKCAPCPICGKEPGMIMTSIGGEGMRYAIRCDSYLSNDRTRAGEHYVSTDRLKTPEQVADQWNELYGEKEPRSSWPEKARDATVEPCDCPDCGGRPQLMHIAGTQKGYRYICVDPRRKKHRNEGGMGATIAEAAEKWNEKYRKKEEEE